MSLGEVLAILKETEKKFSTFNKKGDALAQGGNFKTSKENYIQAAELLVNLPCRLKDLLEKIDSEKKEEALAAITFFKNKAQGAIDNNSLYLLSSFLFSGRGQEKNDLEALIDSLSK